MNSKINLQDLRGYARKFDEILEKKFNNELLRIKGRLGEQPIDDWYEQLLTWRHAFAHAGQRSTTIEEVFRAHQFAKYVLFAFYKAFTEVSPSKKAQADSILKEFQGIRDVGQSLLDDSTYLAACCADDLGVMEQARDSLIELSKLFLRLRSRRRFWIFTECDQV
ncbi:hypothetical protein I0D68_19975 [Pseudomonas lalucatii]|nr:hypothetical protein I0D68_19975 [Pseudomonas lalucatii]